MPTSRMSKSCDQCRNRKVRCLVPITSPGEPVACTHCVKRNETCRFGKAKERPVRRTAQLNTYAPPTSLFIDRLFENPSERALLYDEFSVLRADDGRVPSSGLAFFSDKKVESLVKRLGNAEIRDLVHQIDNAIRMRLLANSNNDITSVNIVGPLASEQPSSAELKSYANSYFEIIHPVFPFLDRSDFEGMINDVQLPQILNTDSAFCALFYAVMALGCQYHGHGSFQPGVGEAWKFFQISFSYVPRVITSQESLPTLQALIAMAIFAMNTCSLQIENFLIGEASRTVLALRYHKSILIDANAAACYRAFWVVYHMEKQYSFQARSSSTIIDLDIGCQIPPVPESIVKGFNWFMASIRISRIFSIAYDSLFSVTASTQPAASLLLAVDHTHRQLEDWRQSIPLIHRPREVLQRPFLADMGIKEIIIRTHFYYFHLIIALERMSLHLSPVKQKADDSLHTMLNAATTVVELTRFIDVEPYTPVFILAIMPLSALFILFDFIIHCPAHSDIRKYLILLDIVSGHFSLLEHASRGSLPGNYLSRFAHIARQHVEHVASQPVDNTRTDSAMVRGEQHHHDTSSRADISVGDNTELDGTVTSNYHYTNDGFNQEPFTGLNAYGDSATENASPHSTDIWPIPLQIENETGLSALFASAVSWEDLMESTRTENR
ncbi:hypothetical protein N7449_008184 [Penicillium cf. viridicatum]|uniref:Zn(2)-C6 fungal-type domain-containing protein n=1 Tax=Penicillium cf. viridicatum TaxID=2972119 RepID=A0A9W9JIP1_9EURO|nr:hypothetical protein N7449_008184 [Penicillium cf. viridicatum]